MSPLSVSEGGMAALLAVPGVRHVLLCDDAGAVLEAGDRDGFEDHILAWARNQAEELKHNHTLDDLVLSTTNFYRLVRRIELADGELWALARVAVAEGNLARARRALAGLRLDHRRAEPPAPVEPAEPADPADPAVPRTKLLRARERQEHADPNLAQHSLTPGASSSAVQPPAMPAFASAVTGRAAAMEKVSRRYTERHDDETDTAADSPLPRRVPGAHTAGFVLLSPARGPTGAPPSPRRQVPDEAPTGAADDDPAPGLSPWRRARLRRLVPGSRATVTHPPPLPPHTDREAPPHG